MGEEKSGLGTRAEWITAAVILALGMPLALWWANRPAESKQTVPFAAVQACQQRVRDAANNPSTVKFSLAGRATDMEGSSYRVRLGYTAKNAFGVEFRMDSLCIFEPGSDSRIARFGTWEKNR